MDIINKLVSEKAWLLFIFGGLVLAVAVMNFMAIEVSQILIFLLGAFVKTFLDVASKEELPQARQAEQVKTEPPQELSLAEKLDKLAEEVSR